MKKIAMVAAKKRRKVTLLRLTCFTVSITILLAGLWPFNFFPSNNVRWLPDQEALRFGRYGIASSLRPIAVPGEILDFRKPILFGIKVRPLGEPGNSIPRILSICDDHFRELFFVGQWKNHLIIRLANLLDPPSDSYRETGVNNLFRKGEPLALEIHSDNSGLSIFADGRLALSQAGYSLSRLSGIRTQATLLLGNSPTGESPWEGDILGLSIHQDTGRTQNLQNNVLMFAPSGKESGAILRTENKILLEFFIPSTFKPNKRTVLFPPWKETRLNRSFWKDVIANILGFIPFGFIFYTWRKGSPTEKDFSTGLFVVLLGAVISLSIELLQVFLPTRDSSLTDVVSNTLGASLGVLLCLMSERLLFVIPSLPWARG